MKVTGGCHCGHITYEAEVDPATVRVCHCTDCQKLTGTAFRAAIPSLPETFVLKSGTPRFTSRLRRAGRNAGTPSARNAARRSMPPRPSRTRQFMDCGSAGSTSALNSPRQCGSNGAARRYPGRWTCERSRSRTANNRSTCRWAKK